MLFLASDLLSRAEVPPVVDSAVLVGSDGEGAAVGLAAAPSPVDAVCCARGGCSPGISPLDLWHPASATTAIVSPRTITALAPPTSRRTDREGRTGEAWLCSECPDPYGGSGTGESIR